MFISKKQIANVLESTFNLVTNGELFVLLFGIAGTLTVWSLLFGGAFWFFTGATGLLTFGVFMAKLWALSIVGVAVSCLDIFPESWASLKYNLNRRRQFNEAVDNVLWQKKLVRPSYGLAFVTAVIAVVMLVARMATNRSSSNS